MMYLLNTITALIISACLLFSCKNSTNKINSSTKGLNYSRDSISAVSSIDSLAYVMGKFKPDTSDLFVVIPDSMADRSGLLLRKEVYSAFRQMYETAQKDGIQLTIRSATRNFTYQKGIWERKWTGATAVSGMDLSKTIKDPYARAQKILQYSSMPGSSRHHWGTEVDLNSFKNKWFESGKGLKLYNWLEKHAHEYGFCQPYNNKSVHGRTGYSEEKWHWSYRPISDDFTAFAEAHLTDEMITGFSGAHTADSLNIVDDYVLGLSRKCTDIMNK